LLDEHGNLKISDFGLSALYVGDADGDGATRTQQLLHTTCGTPNYVAPEVLADKGYDGKKADVWSIGVILYVLLAGFLPFDETTIVALFSKIQAADFSYPSWFSPEVRALLDRVLVADPNERVSLSELKKDPWCLKPSETPVVAAPSDGEPAFPVNRGVSGHSFKGMPKIPTEAQINAGIANAVQEDVVPSVSEGPTVGKDANKRINVFDLINQTGGFALDRLIQRQRGDKTVKRIFHYSSNFCPPSRLMQSVISALQDMQCEVSVANDDPLKVRATLLTPKGMIGLTIEVFSLLDSLCLLEIRRGKGDIMEFHEFISDLIGRRIASVINNSAPEGSGGK
jgi:serine/threonine protein kinase